MSRTLFHYSSYWRTWSRVLPGTAKYPYVEVNLTPIHDVHFSDTRRSGWEGEVAPIVIRGHYTARSDRDIDTDSLPDEVLRRMRDHLPADIVDRLLHEDFQIDWEQYNANSRGGGGVEYALCRRV